MNQQPMTQAPSQEMMGEDQMMQEEMMMQEDMHQRLLAVVGLISTVLDKYIDIKVDYLSAYNKLQEMKGEEGEDTAEKMTKCIAWRDSVLAQAMQLLGAEYQEDMVETEMIEQETQPEMEGKYE